MLPELIGGSADLTGSNLTNWSDCIRSRAPAAGNYVNFGVREFGMSRDHRTESRCTAASFPYGATFLTFSDYARNALRMAALMKCA